MKRLIAAAVLALGMAMLCSMRVYAAGGQRIVTLPEGGPYRLDAAAIERETGPFEALAVTLAPEGTVRSSSMRARRWRPTGC